MRVCQTPGCGATCYRRYCMQCRFMRNRAAKEGKDPDVMGWKQLDGRYWDTKEKSSHVAG